MVGLSAEEGELQKQMLAAAAVDLDHRLERLRQREAELASLVAVSDPRLILIILTQSSPNPHLILSTERARGCGRGEDGAGGARE